MVSLEETLRNTWRNYWVALSLTGIFLILACEQSETEAQDLEIPDDVTFEIIESDIMDTDEYPTARRSIDVRINQRIGKEVLRSIAYKLKGMDERDFDQTFIVYYLPDMEVGAGGWATTHFDPDLEVRILGSTKEEYQQLMVEETENGREFIGRWKREGIISPRIEVFYRNDQLIMEQTYEDGSTRELELLEEETDRGLMLIEEGGDTDDYYLINEEGELEIRDDMGLIDTASSIE